MNEARRCDLYRMWVGRGSGKAGGLRGIGSAAQVSQGHGTVTRATSWDARPSLSLQSSPTWNSLSNSMYVFTLGGSWRIQELTGSQRWPLGAKRYTRDCNARFFSVGFKYMPMCDIDARARC